MRKTKDENDIIVEQLNAKFEPYGYFVFPNENRNKNGVWDLYVKGSPRGLEWFGEIDFQKVEDVDAKFYVDLIKDLNNHRLLPAYCFDPTINDEYRIELSFQEYLSKMGFERAKWDSGYARNTMVRRDGYGSIVFSITLAEDYVYYCVNEKQSTLSCKFNKNEIKSLIDAIDSIVVPQVYGEIANGIAVIENRKGRIKDVKETEMKGLTMFISSIKEKTIKSLEEALRQLKELDV